MKRASIHMILIFSILVVQGQDLVEEYRRYRSAQEQDFLREKQLQDSIFSQEIKQNWRSFTIESPHRLEQQDPKPEVQPEQNGPIAPDKHIAPVEPIKLRSFEPPKYHHLDFYPEEDRTAAFIFYGRECHFNYPSDLLLDWTLKPTKEFVADFWDEMNKRPYQKVVNDLRLLQDELSIPGYGLYLLTKDFTDQMLGNADLKVLYQWFFLIKAGYDVRVGFSQSVPVLVITSDIKIYEKPFFREGNKTFYVLADNLDQISSYGETSSVAEQSLGLVFHEPAGFPLKPKKKTLSFDHSGTSYEWELYYDLNLVNFLEQFPLTDLPTYLLSKGSLLLERSLVKATKEEVALKNDAELIALFLSMSQKSFGYETDQVQFGKEKVMYPDQVVHYAKSDCDDRVVFLNYLIGLFTDVKTVALIFPQHVALGAKLPIPAYGETVDYNGNRFTFCDPTYLNAPIGTVIPQAERSRMKVLGY